MNPTYYVNPDFKKTERLFPPQGRYEYKRHDMNENPEGVPLDFVQKVLSKITPEFLSTYPEASRFEEKYANFVGVNQDNIMTTNGSDQAIRYILQTFGEPGKKVVTASPTFEMYWVNCSLLGLKHVGVPYAEDLSFDSQLLLNSIDHDTRVVVLLNPNNPIGNVYTEEEVETIIRKSKEVGAVVVIDEAYHYFYKKTYLAHINTYDNVLILRTFSKCFSLAACRLGVIIAHSELIKWVRKPRLSFDVNSIALLFAESLLDSPDVISYLIKTQDDGKSFALHTLAQHGYECMDCHGNYIFIKTNQAPAIVEYTLKNEHKILTKTFSNPILASYLRVSTGSIQSMQTFLTAFLKVDIKS